MADDHTPLFFWPSDMGACRYFRSKVPGDAIAAHDGRSVQVGEQVMIGGRAMLAMPAEVQADPSRLVVLQRSHNVSAQRTMVDFCRDGRPWVFDIDDDLWAVEHDNPAIGVFGRKSTMDTLTWMVQNATAVTVSTEPLAEVVTAMTESPVLVFPNALPAAKVTTDDVGDREPCVFWRGSATHDRDVDIMRYALNRVERYYPNVRIVLAGKDYRKRLRLQNAEMLDDILYDDPEWAKLIRVNRWSRTIQQPDGSLRRSVHLPTDEYLRAVSELVQPTIALCPLRSSVFNDSKSHIAALEGHCVGAYVIASDMPAYRWYLADGSGALARWNEHAWWAPLRDALDMSAADRAAWADRGRARAIETSVETLAPAYAKFFDGIMA